MVFLNIANSLPAECEVKVIAGRPPARARRGDTRVPGDPGRAGGRGGAAGVSALPANLEHLQVDGRGDLLLSEIPARLYGALPWSAGSFFYPRRHALFGRRAARLCAEHRAECIAFAACPQWAPALRSHNPKARLVLFVRTEWLMAAPLWLARQLECVDAIICPYGSLAERAARRFPRLAAKLRVILDGVDPEMFQPHNVRARHRVLYVGRISPERGVHLLVEAYLALKERYPDAELVLAGNPDRSPFETLVGTPFGRHRPWWQGRRAYFRRLLRRTRDARGVLLAEQIPYEALPRLYATASLLAVPALVNAPTGLTVAEAMASGLPVVASRIGPAAELVQDGRTGSLVDPGDVRQLGAAIEKLLDNREIAARMSEAARTRAVEHLTWKRVTAACLEAAGLERGGDAAR